MSQQPVPTAYQKVNIVDSEGNVLNSFGSDISGQTNKVFAFDFISTSSSGTLPSQVSSVSISNLGNNNALVKNKTLEPGITISVKAPDGGTIQPFNYDAAGSRLLIAYLYLVN